MTIFTCRSTWRKLEQSECKLEEHFKNARTKRMQAEGTTNTPTLVEETAIYAHCSRHTMFLPALKTKTVDLNNA
jgi:hypothetical protein